MRPPNELVVQRKLTKEFIDADYVDLTLHTRVKPSTGPNKGVLLDGPDRPLQRFRLIPQTIGSDASRSALAAALGGYYTKVPQESMGYVLMGEWDCEMDINDWWEQPDTNELLEVVILLSNNGYERKAAANIYDRTGG